MLTITQKIAKLLGKKDVYSRNTWYGPEINHPYNISLYIGNHTYIALGAVTKPYLWPIVRENIKNLLPNTFAQSLDTYK